MTWLKLSSADYSQAGIDAMLESMLPGQLDPQHWQDDAEDALAHLLDVPREMVLLTGSGTAALTIAHQFLGDRGRLTVEAPVMTWPSSYSYARDVQLRDVDFYCPHFTDWSPVQNRLRVPVALWGIQVPETQLQLCRERGPVVYDCSHALGFGLPELRTGLVDAVVYSFGPTKQIPCVRGGAVVSMAVNAAWRAFRDSGTEGRNMVIPRGGNYEIAEPFAALLCHQLRRYHELQDRRREIIQTYETEFKSPRVGGTHLLTQGECSGHLAVVRVVSESARAVRMGRLLDAEIQCGIHYPLPQWLVPLKYPNALRLSQQILSLPCHTHMTPDDARRVIAVLEKYNEPNAV